MPHRNKSTFLIIIMVLQLLSPIPSYALSGGNKAPEFESFQPFGLDNMVDPATGDFSYNIPLMNVGFHGVNLFYQAGITMDQEATMVGLGWNINSGMINRTVRGIPDDFDGDTVTKELYYKPNVTVGLKIGKDLEVVGGDKFKLKAGVGLSHNNMKGIGFDWTLSPSFTVTKYAENDETKGLGTSKVNQDTSGFSATASLNISSSTHGGMSLQPNVSFKRFIKESEKESQTTIGIGTSINSRSGLKTLSLNTSFSGAEKVKFFKPRTSSEVSFSKSSFTPYVDFPTKNTAFTFNASFGGAGFSIFGTGSYTGYFSSQKLAENTLALPAFGLLYPNENRTHAIQDFHRAQDGPQTDDIPNLPIPQLDFDIYNLAGPGLSGSFQLKRGDLGLASNRKSFSSSNDASIGGEYGSGSYAHVGGDLTGVSSTTTSKAWEDKNNLISSLSFKENQFGVDYEKGFLRTANEYLVEEKINDDKFTKLKGFDALKPILNKQGLMDYETDTELKAYSGGGTNFSNFDGKNKERLKRNNSISYLTIDEAKTFAFSKYLRSINGATTYYDYLTNNNLFETQGHHVAEITVTNQDGYKYYYGLPVYNITQVEKTFAIDSIYGNKHSIAYEKGTVTYLSGADAIDNNRGKDNYYASTVLPPFVTSYLLTSIVSSDYQDRTGDGPTPDDYGDYVRFNYDQADGVYSWRTPYSKENDLGSHNPGILADPDDDKLNYIYGERQQFFPKSIESKTEIVTYDYYNNRADGIEASSDEGAMGLSKSKALKRLTKYSLPEYMLKKEHAEPLKSVFFEYNYKLCKGIANTENQGDGKLTLDRLYIINGKSNKGRLSPYIFEYSSVNPDYHPKAMNRWAGYQPLNIVSNNNNISVPPDVERIWYEGDLTTVNYPYVPQNQRKKQDLFASAWNLNKIQLPSGGTIHVNYEADDYSHVQDKRAMQMFKIAGLTKFNNERTNKPPTFSSSSILYDDNINNDIVFFELENQFIKDIIQGDNSSKDKDIIFSEYIRDISTKTMYFKIFGQYRFFGLNDDTYKYEYVPGWTKIEDWGTSSAGTKKYGYVKLKLVSLKDREVTNLDEEINPMSKAFMQAIRLNFPEVIYPYSGDPPKEDSSFAKQAIRALIGTLSEIPSFVQGINKKLKNKGFGSKLMKSKSFIRLYNPIKKKVSGSHRVKSILISDNWDMMTDSGLRGFYGKRYNYTEVEDIYNNSREISTGVAAYEPMVGGEENSLRMAIEYKEELLLAPDNTKYQEEPLMEDYYPAPRIIYSKIKVEDIFIPSDKIGDNYVFDEEDVELYKNTGYTVNEHFTYKDYPIKVQNTSPEPKTSGTPKKFKLLKIVLIDRLTTVQGYAIHNPHMHGKAKANYHFNSSGQLISGQEFEYLEDDKGRLDYNVKALFSDGQIKDARMGIDYSLFGDSREVTSITETSGFTFNADVFPITAAPATLPTSFPKMAYEEKRFRSLVLVKSIRQNGILKSTTTINGSARIKTEHILWDAETGNPIVTKTSNEFEDPIYQVNLPAHLAYKEMGQVYQNIGAKFENQTCINGNLFFTSDTQLQKGINTGDKLAIYDNGNYAKTAWVLYRDSTKAYLIDEDGNPFESFGSMYIRVLESGFNNKAGEPIGVYVVLDENPINEASNSIQLDDGIIDASVTTYDDQWQSYCTEAATNNETSCECSLNPDGRKFIEFLDELMESNANSTGVVQTFMPPLYNEEEECDYSNYSYIPNWEIGYLQFKLSDDNCSCDSRIYFEPRIPLVLFANINIDLDNFSSQDCNSKSINFNDVTVNYQNGETRTAKMIIESDDCLNFLNCATVGASSTNLCGIAPGFIANPFIHNIKGNWRPKKSYVFQTDRQASDNIAKDGVYTLLEDNYNNGFQNFWDENYSINEDKWTWTNETTTINSLGIAQEAKDPLDRYSAEVLGYNAQKVIAVAANAKLNEIAYSGFEQSTLEGIDISANQSFYDAFIYNSESGTTSLNPNAPDWDFGCVSNVHFPIEKGVQVKSGEGKMPNSGNYSQRLLVGNTLLNEFETSPSSKEPIKQVPFTPYIVDECDCLTKFAPTVGKKYLISAWIKDIRLDGSENESGAYLKIKLDNQEVDIKDYGPLIEGWRKIEGTFAIDDNVNGGKIIVANGNTSCYIDDLRIHPYNASMKTYNYDQQTLRFTYEHDDNNFFTRYDYAEDGTLERINKQTERGVMTLQESTFSQQKKTN